VDAAALVSAKAETVNTAEAATIAIANPVRAVIVLFEPQNRPMSRSMQTSQYPLLTRHCAERKKSMLSGKSLFNNN
jgi:hypothetical protein